MKTKESISIEEFDGKKFQIKAYTNCYQNG